MKIFINGFCLIVVLGVSVLSFFNIVHNKYFFSINIYNVITILIAVFLTFYFVQMKNEERKRKEVTEGLIDALQKVILENLQLIEQESGTNQDNESIWWGKILINKRIINSKIRAIDKLSPKLGIDEEVKQLMNKNEEYDSLVESIQTMKIKTIDAKSIMHMIDNKCDSAKVNLYCKYVHKIKT